ncbi:L-glyceraldehyde 3-phosphate reductase [Cellvibrio japonicus]|uniref:Oxidoreductase, aldo/keto reductase family n=1 Tax=Cellvibrio japonicus (strain Ueda107) TaxID=498211 RepID=B3PD44_CELJU|nr:L-glyceraldehyde 3-phosphate reductase [Cellvibrio japonicus]ACE83969.1 oxidoreductase, aldo/keto reductase family [Cellvibrio japonicus Ueda107]QEI11977.1 L-glyceraldehyde 3-phosphate reductase [Cellvibrio japonicus]QEI15551.1 L-glyceraldehyde 3-phosphate reductase [Cellvibrio japonicus]QEI19130.1 L-glyceraldehyde 3-phosphate reductase [Cellvibrio japonicus]
MITHEPNPLYAANPERYKTMQYQRCGRSGLKLPKLSLGLWQNFGAVDSQSNARHMLRRAFDLGITHFDLANNYGPHYGSAEQTFGAIYAQDFAHYRDELIISSKAGYDMWPGPYGKGGSRKYLVSSCDQSLKRTGLDYFDIFYHHCMDAETPIEESMQALDYIVRSGRALYVGISSYQPAQTREAVRILRDLGTPLLIHQPRYNLFDRWIEKGLTDVLLDEGVGSIVFSPLAQGVLTNKYLQGIPADSRAARPELIYLNNKDITPEKIEKVNALNRIAEQRGQSLAQMAIAWTLHNPAVTSCLIGASRASQIDDSVAALNNLHFSTEELAQIDAIAASQ